MQAIITIDGSSTLAACAPVPAMHEAADVNIIEALMEALTSGEHYEVVERGGSLYVQPLARTEAERATPPAFSPDARARFGEYALAA